MAVDKKTVIGLVVAGVIAVGAFLTNGGDVGAALRIAFDKDAAAAECKVLLTEQGATITPAAETPAQ